MTNAQINKIVLERNNLRALLEQAVAYQKDAFAEDDPVSGADLVEWFYDWRNQVLKALG